MNGIRHFLKNWSIISCTTLVINYLLWWLITSDELCDKYPYGWEDFVFDLCYCALYVLASLSVSNLIRKLLLDGRLRKKQRLGSKYPSFVMFFLHSGAMLVANVLIAIVFDNVVNCICDGGEEFYYARLYVCTICATLLTIIYLCLYYSRIVIRQGNRNVEMQKELLKLQLDPHFVFNSLSTLTELISEDAELAENFTLKFSAIYRYIVNQLNKETVTIAEEIRFIRDYCDLLSIRHPRHFLFEIDERLAKDNSLILPMSVQILIENAVKHNSHSVRRPLRVSISREDDWIVVRNERIPLTGKSPSTNKIGLKNLSERYGLQELRPIITENEKMFEVKLPIIPK